MILFLAPKYRNDQIYLLYSNLDTSKDGIIQKEEILRLIGKGLINQKHYIGIWHEKALRNLKSLRLHIQCRKLTPDQVMEMGDLNLDDHIDEKEFLQLMKMIEFEISED